MKRLVSGAWVPGPALWGGPGGQQVFNQEPWENTAGLVAYFMTIFSKNKGSPHGLWNQRAR